VMLLMHDLVRRRFLQGQAPVQPSSCRRGLGILIAQPQDQLDDEGGRKGAARLVAANQHVRLGRISVHPQQPIDRIVRILARRAAADDAGGRAPQILDEHDAKRDGDRP
jgi:hypothetical protein